MVSDQCLDFGSEAASFVLGDVPAEDRAAMVTHLDTCPTCRREVTTLAEALDAISGATVPMEPSPGFVERVLAAGEPIIASTPLPGRPETTSALADVVPLRRRGAGGAAAPYRPPVAVVMRRRRTLLCLSAATAALSLMAVGIHTWVLPALAILSAMLDVAYLGLVIRVTHTRARYDIDSTFRTARLADDDDFWRKLESEVRFIPSDDERVTPSVVGVGNTTLARFVVAYFIGWLLTPLVALIGLVRGDLAGIEQSPVLGRIVDLQRRGRAQSLKLLVAGATTVAVAGGGTAATVLVAPDLAAAATPAPTYTVHQGDTLSGIAARYGIPVSQLARLNGISDPNVILPGEVITVAGTAGDAAAALPAGSAGYTVRPGDTLDAVAARFGTSEEALASINHLADPNLILVGQVLRLPRGAGPSTAAPGAGSSAPAAARAGGTYTVEPGDTLASIAARFGTTVANLAAVNRLADPNRIEAGQVLRLSGSPAPAPAGPAPSPRLAPAPAPAPRPAPTPVPAVTASAPASSSYVNPFRYGSWSPSRIDEGVDWIPNTVSPVVAVGDGVVTYSSMSSGWPAGGFITYRLTSGSHAGLYIYVAEHITGLLPAGTVVHAGQQIATALPGYPWTEWGWASAYGPEPAPSARYNGAADGRATPGGRAFARFLISLGVTGLSDPGPGPSSP